MYTCRQKFALIVVITSMKKWLIHSICGSKKTSKVYYLQHTEVTWRESEIWGNAYTFSPGQDSAVGALRCSGCVKRARRLNQNLKAIRLEWRGKVGNEEEENQRNTTQRTRHLNWGNEFGADSSTGEPPPGRSDFSLGTHRFNSKAYPLDSAEPAKATFAEVLGLSACVLNDDLDWIFWNSLDSPDFTPFLEGAACSFGVKSPQGGLMGAWPAEGPLLTAAGPRDPAWNWCWLKDWGMTAALTGTLAPATGLAMPSPPEDTPAPKADFWNKSAAQLLMQIKSRQCTFIYSCHQRLSHAGLTTSREDGETM
jgi:hypothetical protein